MMGRSFPHGWYSLLLVLLAVIGWFSSLWQGDGCNYSVVSGPIVGQLDPSLAGAGNMRVTTLELGFDSFRELPNVMSIDLQTEARGDDDGDDETNDNTPSVIVPSISTTLTSSVVANATDSLLHKQRYKARCIDYPEEIMNGIVDSSWTTSRSFAFLGLVLGGAGATFLACSLCFVFSKVTWRWTGYGLLLASLFQILSLATWFSTQMCSWNRCGWSMGSISDVCAVIFWAVTGGLILCHYPTAKMAGTTNRSNNIPNGKADGEVKTDGDIENNLRHTARGKSFEGSSGRLRKQHTLDSDEDCDERRYPQGQIT